MSLLTIIQEATRRIAIEVPNVIVSSTDAHEQQLRALANEEGRDLAKRYAWQKLTKEVTFASLAAEEQPNILPGDLGWIINNTFYNRTRARKIVGPLSPEQWQAQLAVNYLVAVQSYRIRGDTILLAPAPAAGEVIAFEYVSKNWNISNDEPVDSFLLDGDTPLLPEEIIILGVKWRYLNEKRLDYAEAFALYENQLASLFGRDGTKRTVSLGCSYRVPESNYILPVG